MTERQYVEGKKPDREIPAEKIGRLELATDVDAKSAEASGRTSPFWVKCWSCHQYLTRPLGIRRAKAARALGHQHLGREWIDAGRLE